MELRTGFVSNSSSSSFCLCKSFMTDEQIKKFKEYLDSDDMIEDYDTSIYSGKYAFFGEVSMHADPSPREICEKIGVDPKYCEYYN